jgi:hypothetical protein
VAKVVYNEMAATGHANESLSGPRTKRDVAIIKKQNHWRIERTARTVWEGDGHDCYS